MGTVVTIPNFEMTSNGMLFQKAFFLSREIGCVLVFAITFCLFSPALEYDFVNWDDPFLVIDNAQIRGLGMDSVVGMFSSLCTSNYTPLERLSYAVDYCVWGMNPWGFHFTNILLHAFNAVLVYILAWRIFSIAFLGVWGLEERKNPKGDWRKTLSVSCAALAFAIHPLRVESVVWISERRDVLSLFFLLLCTLLYLRTCLSSVNATQVTWKQSRDRIITWFLFVCALLSKANGVMLPLVFLLLDFYPLKRFSLSREEFRSFSKCLLEKIPYLIVSLVMGGVAIWAQSQRGAMVSLENYHWSDRLVNACVALVFYVQKWVFPWPLFPLYASFSRKVSFFNPAVFLSAIWVSLVSIYVTWIARRKAEVTVVWWSYVMMILPFTGLLQAGNQSAADRYTYLSTIPFALLLGASLNSLLMMSFSKGKGIRMIGIGFCGVLLCGWAFLTARQIPIWQNPISLWEYAIQEVPHEFLALNNYSTALIGSGKFYLATVTSRVTTRVRPYWDVGWYNHGIALSLSGRSEEAIRVLQRALQLNPGAGETHLTLGNLLFLKGDVIEARRHYFASLQDQWTTKQLTNLAIALHATKQSQLALKYLCWAVLEKDPQAYVIWAKILVSQARIEEARALLRLGYRSTHDPAIHELELKLERLGHQSTSHQLKTFVESPE